MLNLKITNGRRDTLQSVWKPYWFLEKEIGNYLWFQINNLLLFPLWFSYSPEVKTQSVSAVVGLLQLQSMQAKEIALFVCHLHFVCVANWKILRQSQAKQSNYVANWVGWSRGRRAVGWMRVEARGIATSCASHTIRARPTPSALPSLISHTNWLRPRGQHEIFMSLAAKA